MWKQRQVCCSAQKNFTSFKGEVLFLVDARRMKTPWKLRNLLIFIRVHAVPNMIENGEKETFPTACSGSKQQTSWVKIPSAFETLNKSSGGVRTLNCQPLSNCGIRVEKPSSNFTNWTDFLHASFHKMRDFHALKLKKYAMAIHGEHLHGTTAYSMLSALFSPGQFVRTRRGPQENRWKTLFQSNYIKTEQSPSLHDTQTSINSNEKAPCRASLST